MNNSWISFCGLLMIWFLASCAGKQANVTKEAELMSNDTLIVETSLEPEPEVEKEVVPTRVDELFDDFIWNFASDERLQRRRIRFPLHVNTMDSIQQVERRDWQHDHLFAEQPTYTLLFDKESDFDFEGDTSLNSAEVEWISIFKRVPSSTSMMKVVSWLSISDLPTIVFISWITLPILLSL